MFIVNCNCVIWNVCSMHEHTHLEGSYFCVFNNNDREAPHQQTVQPTAEHTSLPSSFFSVASQLRIIFWYTSIMLLFCSIFFKKAVCSVLINNNVNYDDLVLNTIWLLMACFLNVMGEAEEVNMNQRKLPCISIYTGTEGNSVSLAYWICGISLQML